MIGIDSVPARLRLAALESGAETLNFEAEDVFERLKTLTGGMGPDACIDASDSKRTAPRLMLTWTEPKPPRISRPIGDECIKVVLKPHSDTIH